MKSIKYILLLVIGLINLSVYSQIDFSIEIGETNKRTTIYDLLQNSDNEYIIAGYKSDVNVDTINMYIAKLSEQGELITDTIFSRIDTSAHIKGIHKIGNNHILAYSILTTTIDNNNLIMLTEFDENFNIIKQNKHKLPNNNNINQNRTNIVLSDNSIICFGSSDSSAESFLYKFDYNLDSLTFKEYSDTRIIDLSYKDPSNLNLLGAYFGEPYSAINIYNISTLNLEKTDSLNTYDGIGIIDIEIMYSKQFTDNSFLFLGLDIPSENLSLSKIDNELNVIKTTAFGLPNNQDFLGQNSSIDFINNNNSIYVVSQYLISPYFSMTKLNSDIEIEWEHFFTVKDAWLLAGVKATNDNGAIMWGLKYDGTNNNSFFLKSGALGPNSNTNSIIKSHELIIYPNPGNENMQVRTAVQQLGGVFYIYDITGKLVLQQEVTSSITQINTSRLLSGTYIYKYINNNKLLESGKWVKE